MNRIVLALLVAGVAAGGGCGGGGNGASLPDAVEAGPETEDVQPDLSVEVDTAADGDLPQPDVKDAAADETGDVTEPPPDESEPEADVVLEIPDVKEIKDEASPPEEIIEDIQVDEGPGVYVPDFLALSWTNLEDMDMVTVKKRIVLEFFEDTPLPEYPLQEEYYNKTFVATLTPWDPATATPGPEIEIKKIWRHPIEGMLRRPQLVIQPVSNLDPTTVYRVTVFLGDTLYERVFHTLPAWAPGYKKVEFTLPAEECEGCWPFPVHMIVFLPPEYYSDDPYLNNTTTEWPNMYQRYPMLIGLHGYNGAGINMEGAYGYSTLPRFSSQGILEPIILVLPDGTVPQPYCGNGWNWPGTTGNTCYTQFLGTGGTNFSDWTTYTYFLAYTLPKLLGQQLRFRGMDDFGNALDTDYYRRARGITGLSGGGYAALINAFQHPDAYGSVYGLVPTTVSIFDPYTYYYPNGGVPSSAICNQQGNNAYPFVPRGDGYEDKSLHDPATGKVRDITFEMREVWEGAKSCFWFNPPLVSHALVASVLCHMDAACMVDPGAPEWASSYLHQQQYPYDGNIWFSTGTRDPEGPASAFIDLDQQLDKGGIVHTFRYEDRGGVYHDWQSIYDQVVGNPIITWQDGTQSPGNYVGTGALYPFFTQAFEGYGYHPFNHPFASEFTTGALDPDRDFYIDCDYEDLPDLKYVEDNCPGTYNPDQLDSDGDGVGDACDAEGGGQPD